MNNLGDLNIKVKFLKDEDTFGFNCKICGDCCGKTLPIDLNPYDLYKILKFSGKKLIDLQDVLKMGNQNDLVLTNFVLDAYEGKCIFLKDNRCSLGLNKPTVCKLYPLGRAVKLPKNEVVYFLQIGLCEDDTNFFTLKEWKEKFNLVEDEESFIMYSQYVKVFYGIIDIPILKYFPREKEFLESIFIAPFRSLDVNTSFEYQIEEHYKEGLKLFKKGLEILADKSVLRRHDGNTNNK
jgi:Fe-S-cluster containining protein